MKAVRDKRRKRDAVYAERRVDVWEREGGLCECCRRRAMTCVHHIAGRGGPDPHRLTNLAGLCDDCHRRVHADPEWARSKGLMRSRHSKLA